MPEIVQGHQILPVPAPEPRICDPADSCLSAISLRRDRMKAESRNESYHGDVEFKDAGERCGVSWLLDYKKPDSDSNLSHIESITARSSQIGSTVSDLPSDLLVLSLAWFDLQTPLVHLMHVPSALHVLQNVIL